MRLNWGARPGLALLSIGVGLLGASSASAIPYEVFIDVATEEGLYDLQVSGQISDASFDTLLLLFQTKVDINAAGRARLYTLPNLELHHVDAILAYRARARPVDSIDTLVEATVLSPELADSVRAFVVLAPSTERGRESVRGSLRVESRWTGRYDRLPPATVAQTRISAPYGVDLGAVALVVRNQVGQVRWDPNRQALSARPEQVRFLVPKLYAQWTGTRFAMVAGTYRIGFGQRLTFDVTGQSTPDGFFGDQEFRRENELVQRCRLSLGERLVAPCGDRDTWRVTPDYGWTNRLTGVALRGRVELTDGALEAFVWGSYQPHRVPRLEIVRADRCADARFDDDPDCQAPAVYARETELSKPAAAWTQVALPRMLTEAVVGAHLGYARNDRTGVGATGYGAIPRWLVDGVTLDFQEFARRPSGGAFGAGGVQASHGFGVQDFSIEIARSFDAQSGGGGGFGGVLRSLTSTSSTMLEITLRYYDPKYANPYARPVSAPDEFEGLRARNEVGVQLSATTRLGSRLGLRTLVDLWRAVSHRGARATLYARLDAGLADEWTLSLWSVYRSLRRQHVSALRVRYEREDVLRLAGQLQHRANELGAAPLSKDLVALVELAATPLPILRIKARSRYDIERIGSRQRGLQALWNYLDASVRIRSRSRLSARYDLRVFVDRRESTATRQPNPEHWLRIEYEFRL